MTSNTPAVLFVVWGVFKSYSGKRVLVTGSTRGLGRDLVRDLYAQGAVIFALAQNADNLSKLQGDFPNISTICTDLSDWKATREAVEKIGPVDCLVNNAAIVVGLTPYTDITEDNFDLVMAVNLKGALNVSQIVVKGMIAAGTGGSIVNVSSILGTTVMLKGSLMYSMSKAAMNMMTKTMAVEFGAHNIRVNSVSPSLFESDMTKGLLEVLPDGGPDFQRRSPIKRIANTNEIVNSILFLLSDAAPMVNAQNLFVDGGLTVT